jgi:hypothetical protein
MRPSSAGVFPAGGVATRPMANRTGRTARRTAGREWSVRDYLKAIGPAAVSGAALRRGVVGLLHHTLAVAAPRRAHIHRGAVVLGHRRERRVQMPGSGVEHGGMDARMARSADRACAARPCGVSGYRKIAVTSNWVALTFAAVMTRPSSAIRVPREGLRRCAGRTPGAQCACRSIVAARPPAGRAPAPDRSRR